MAKPRHHKLHDAITGVLTAEHVPDDGLTVTQITARLRAAEHDTTTVDVALALGVMELLDTAQPSPFGGNGCTRYWTATPKDTP